MGKLLWVDFVKTLLEHFGLFEIGFLSCVLAARHEDLGVELKFENRADCLRVGWRLGDPAVFGCK